MAAWGASDSVIMRTPVSLKSCRSLFFFSRLLSAGGSAQQTHAFILAQYHTLCLTSATRGLQRGGHWPTQQYENGKKWKQRSPQESLFPFQWMVISLQSRREGTFHIHESCTHIYLTYISLSTHPAVLFWATKRQICKNLYLWRPDRNCSFSFRCPLRCLPNTVDLNEEKSLITPPPPRPSTLIKTKKMFVSPLKMESLKDLCAFVSVI